jgi:recombination protein RecR
MDTINKLKNIFRNFPTVGQRTASRFVYYLMKLPKEETDELINSILELRSKIKLCQLCFNPFETNGDPMSANLCAICSDPKRNKNLLCIIEKETDLLSIESTNKFNGVYFILGGTIGTMRKEDISNLRLEQLKKRVSQNNFSEIIVALNPTPEGRATSILVEQTIKETNKSYKNTHLAKGIPVGGELEYADEETLENALEGRK